MVCGYLHPNAHSHIFLLSYRPYQGNVSSPRISQGSVESVNTNRKRPSPPVETLKTLFGLSFSLSHTMEETGGILSLDMSEFFPSEYVVSGENGYKISGVHKRDRKWCPCVTDWCPTWCPLCPLLQWSELTGKSGHQLWSFKVDLTPQHNAANCCLLCECLGLGGYEHTQVLEKGRRKGGIRHAGCCSRLGGLFFSLVSCQSAVSQSSCIMHAKGLCLQII